MNLDGKVIVFVEEWVENETKTVHLPFIPL